MRSYPSNSPEATARILAMVMLVDGHADQSEIRALETHPAASRLGITPAIIEKVLHELCHDLLLPTDQEWGSAVRLTAETRRLLLAEVTDAWRQASIIELCASLVQADGEVHEAETALVSALHQHWHAANDAAPASVVPHRQAALAA